MPFLPQPMSALIQIKAGSQLIAGGKLPAMVSAMSSAICQYFLTAPVVNSTNNVLGPGAGTQVGRIKGLTPSKMASYMMTKAMSKNIVGKDLERLCKSVATGVVNSLNLVVIQGAVIGGGPGTGTGRVYNLVPSLLTAMIMAQESFKLIGGSKLKDMISAMSFGLCTYLMTFGSVDFVCIGAAAPPPAGPVPIVAPGVGRLY
jgi:hypothetical protein